MTTRSKRPYLLRALFEWIVDSELTPYILVAAGDPGVIVPQQYVDDGKIVLNVSPAAVRNLNIADDTLTFDGRFGGNPFAVEVPMTYVLAIYAKETGEGMMFDPEDAAPQADSADTAKPEPGPHLKVIK